MGCGASSTKKSGLEGLVLGANEDKQKHLSMWFQQQQAIYDDEAAAERQCYQNLLHFGKNVRLRLSYLRFQSDLLGHYP